MTKFSEADARRVLTFCLPRDLHVELERDRDANRCLIRIVPTKEGGGPPRVFEGPTYEAALRAAAEGGACRPECIERQIAFMSSFRSYDAPSGHWTTPGAPPAAPGGAAAAGGPAYNGGSAGPHDALASDPAHGNGLIPLRIPEAEPKRLQVGHYRALAEFRYQIRRFVSFSERAARQMGLEPQQHQVLLAIRGLPPPKRPNLPTLAERMCIEVAACETIVGSLIGRGLLRWTANPTDRREQLLTLTPPARALLRKLTVMHRNQMLAVGPTFVQALGAILSSFEETDNTPDDASS